jgi:hypothetical protein
MESYTLQPKEVKEEEITKMKVNPKEEELIFWTQNNALAQAFMPEDNIATIGSHFKLAGIILGLFVISTSIGLISPLLFTNVLESPMGIGLGVLASTLWAGAALLGIIMSIMILFQGLSKMYSKVYWEGGKKIIIAILAVACFSSIGYVTFFHGILVMFKGFK